jgi:hypothetical protein
MLRRLAASVGVLLVSSVPGQSTTLVPADFGDLVREARTIARGRVAAVEGRWTEDRRSIETIVVLQVDAYLKGPLGATVQFSVPGGTLGRYRRVFVGAPEFAVDQRLIVFLGAQGPTIPYVLGLSQGVFPLVQSSDGASWLVIPPVTPAVAVATPVTRGDAARRPMPLADFVRHVRDLTVGGR